MREFGRTEYEQVVCVNFDTDAAMRALFASDMRVGRIISGLELYAGRRIDPDATLLVFDEIQECPEALASLKYFDETAPQYDIVCAGSLLGVALHGGTSFPVGKVEFMDLRPMSFTEFMCAAGAERFVRLLEARDFEMAAAFRQEYADLLRQYYFVGGMPEAVSAFTGEDGVGRDFAGARAVQRRILDAYEQDFSKHAPNEIVPRIRMLWNSIPAQLARENKKFVYGIVREGARAKDYEAALLWLADCGLVHIVNRATAPRLPLRAYADMKAFKLFAADIGILGCMARLDSLALLSGDKLFTEFKGALTEQYVLQQLKTLYGIEAFYWTNDRGGAEVDFLIDTGHGVVPIEARAETNLKANSLRTYREKFRPDMAIRASMAGYRQDGSLLNLPLWAVETIERIGRIGQIGL
jgi:predicted AAA+ superfamily ATPase